MKSLDILITDVAVRFRKQNDFFLAIKDIHLSCAQGQFVSVLGPSGCGKSTLLRLLAGLITPDQGDLWRNPERLKQGVGYVPQSYELLPWRTLLQNAFIASELGGGKYTRADVDRVEFMIDQFRLSGFQNLYPHELSGGMSQRVALIRALQARPGLLLCDEPFSAVDYVSRHELNIAFKNECATNGITCVMVTHNIEEAIYLSDKIVLMGGAPGTILNEYPYRYLPNRSNPVLCRQSSEFNLFFNEIWSDLNESYQRS